MRKRARMVGALAALALLITAAPALGDAPSASGVVSRVNAVTGGYFYFGGGHVVITGAGDFAGVCADVGFVERTVVSVAPGNGSYHESISHGEEPLMVFAADVTSVPEFFAWIGAACAAGEEPVASGIGRLTSHLQVSASGDVKIQNGVVGTVTTTYGRDVHLRTFVLLAIEGGVENVRSVILNYGG